jgi:hypothetical protein
MKKIIAILLLVICLQFSVFAAGSNQQMRTITLSELAQITDSPDVEYDKNGNVIVVIDGVRFLVIVE